ncbi:MAG: DUF2892 domain-containing protein [Chitinophagaceae bacterium]|nr:DUF2892 domain-containing protein [Chitinophagaceae bacterium]
MKKNVGKKDRTIRFMLAIIIIALGYYYKSWWILLAFVPLLTGYLSFCPLYKIFRLNTCGSRSVQ